MFLYSTFFTLCLLAYTPLSLCAHVLFELNLTWEVRAPDGQSRYVILSNGQFPGPQLNLNYGDDVEVSRFLQSQSDRADSSSLSFTTIFPLIQPSISMVSSMSTRLEQHRRDWNGNADKIRYQAVRYPMVRWNAGCLPETYSPRWKLHLQVDRYSVWRLLVCEQPSLDQTKIIN